MANLPLSSSLASPNEAYASPLKLRPSGGALGQLGPSELLHVLLQHVRDLALSVTDAELQGHLPRQDVGGAA